MERNMLVRNGGVDELKRGLGDVVLNVPRRRDLQRRYSEDDNGKEDVARAEVSAPAVVVVLVRVVRHVSSEGWCLYIWNGVARTILGFERLST